MVYDTSKCITYMYLHVFDVQGKVCNLEQYVHVSSTLSVEMFADTKTVGDISDVGIRLVDVVVGQGSILAFPPY
jgi:hypothetical protein